MPHLRPFALAGRYRPQSCACRFSSTLAPTDLQGSAAQASSSSSSASATVAPRPRSPILSRPKSKQTAPPPPVDDPPPALDLSQLELGSWESQVREQAQWAGLSMERMKALWQDNWGRMMSGPSGRCSATGVLVPQNMMMGVRAARRCAVGRDVAEAMILVPHGILHPDWSASEFADGLPYEEPLRMIISDVIIKRFAGTEDAAPRAAQRLYLDSLPHTLYHKPERPLKPSQTSAGVSTISAHFFEHVDSQLQARVVQEAFVLAERVRAAGTAGADRLVRKVDASEVAQMRAGEWANAPDAGGARACAVLNNDTAPAAMERFWTAQPERNRVQISEEVQDGLAKSGKAGVMPRFATCPMLDGDVPFYSLQSLLSEENRALLAPLLDIISPASSGAPTRALLTSGALLGEAGLDPFPLFRALYRLALLHEHTLAYGPAQRYRLVRLSLTGRDHDLKQAQAARDAAEAQAVPFLPSGGVDIRAVLNRANKKLNKVASSGPRKEPNVGF